MQTIRPYRATACATLLAFGVFTGSAFSAMHEAAQMRVAVAYGDLDISKPEAAEILYRRISKAARRVCDEPTRGSLTQRSHFNHCYQNAVATAVGAVNAQTLTALHRVKTQRFTPS